MRGVRRLVSVGALAAVTVGMLAVPASAAQTTRLQAQFTSTTEYRTTIYVYGTLTAEATGAPVVGRQLTYTIRTAGAILHQVTMTTDANGRARGSVFFTQPRGTYEQRLDFAGDEEFGSAAATGTLRSYPRTPQLGAQGSFLGVKGRTATLGAYLHENYGWSPMVGYPIRFSLGGFVGEASTGTDGKAWVDTVIALDPGRYSMWMSFTGDGAYWASTSDWQDFVVEWPRQFLDAGGAGTVRLNPYTQEFQLAMTECTTSIRRDALMYTEEVDGEDVTTVAYQDADVALSGSFNLDSRGFEAAARACGRFYTLKQVRL